MQVRVQKWGNSLALRIPRTFAREAGLSENGLVELMLEEGRLVIKPVLPRPYRLEDLLAGITAENRHEEIDTGDRLGSEAW